jgi:hypothetical protein
MRGEKDPVMTLTVTFDLKPNKQIDTHVKIAAACNCDNFMHADNHY